jgi:hypothetical protein
MTDETSNLLNDPDKILDADILSIIAEYAELDKDSDAISKKRAKLREKAEKNHGIESRDLQHAVYRLKKQTKAERTKSIKVVNRIIAAVDGKQQEFWPEEVKKQEERTKRKKTQKAKADAKAAKANAESIERGDDMPRSDPNRGGAKPRTGKKKAESSTPVDLAEARSARNKRVDEVQAESPGAHPGTIKEAAKASDEALAKSIADVEQEQGEAAIKELMPQTEAAQAEAQGEKS